MIKISVTLENQVAKSEQLKPSPIARSADIQSKRTTRSAEPAACEARRDAISECLMPPLAAIIRTAEHRPAARRAIPKPGRGAAERLVFDLIDLPDAETGRLRLDRRRTELGRLVSALIPACTAAGELSRIALDIRGSLFAFVDRCRIERVLATLVHHVLRHSTGSISVRVEREDDRVRVAIVDDGPELTMEQSMSALDRQPKHAGVPLYVARKIVEAHGGRINVASTPGRGMKFACELPSALL